MESRIWVGSPNKTVCAKNQLCCAGLTADEARGFCNGSSRVVLRIGMKLTELEKTTGGLDCVTVPAAVKRFERSLGQDEKLADNEESQDGNVECKDLTPISGPNLRYGCLTTESGNRLPQVRGLAICVSVRTILMAFGATVNVIRYREVTSV